MLAIDEAKLPPPRPAVAATTTSSANGVWGWLTAQASNRHGITNRVAEMIVQLRPPKIGTANVYGNRRKAPTPLGTATRHRAWLAVSAQPDGAGWPWAPAVICTTTMLQSIHTLNPTCSAKMEKIRLRRAIALPVVSQNTGSSGRQSSIQRRRR